jgi:hypothetical protein
MSALRRRAHSSAQRCEPSIVRDERSVRHALAYAPSRMAIAYRATIVLRISLIRIEGASAEACKRVTRARPARSICNCVCRLMYVDEWNNRREQYERGERDERAEDDDRRGLKSAATQMNESTVWMRKCSGGDEIYIQAHGECIIGACRRISKLLDEEV